MFFGDIRKGDLSPLEGLAKPGEGERATVEQIAATINNPDYVYKPGAPVPPEQRGKVFAGPTAQAVQKLFPELVVAAPDGTLAIDAQRAVLTTLGIASQLAREIVELKRGAKS